MSVLIAQCNWFPYEISREIIASGNSKDQDSSKNDDYEDYNYDNDHDCGGDNDDNENDGDGPNGNVSRTNRDKRRFGGNL